MARSPWPPDEGLWPRIRSLLAARGTSADHFVRVPKPDVRDSSVQTESECASRAAQDSTSPTRTEVKEGGGSSDQCTECIKILSRNLTSAPLATGEDFISDTEELRGIEATSSPPRWLEDVDADLLESGVITLPGSKDEEGRHLLVLSSKTLSTLSETPVSKLSRLLHYLLNISRRDATTRWHLYIDGPLSPSSWSNVEEIWKPVQGAVQVSTPQATDSPRWAPSTLLPPNRLPLNLPGGQLVFCWTAWLRFRKVFESLSPRRRPAPTTQAEIDAGVRELEMIQSRYNQNLDYRYWLDHVKSWFYGEEDTPEQLKAFEERSSQILEWIDRSGKQTLERYQNLAQNLADIKEQEEQFDKFYFLSMRQIEKGNDLVEEAVGSTSSKKLQQMTKHFNHQLTSFSEQLEDIRENLEDCSKCYHLLDKSYEWVYQVKKFANMKMDKNAVMGKVSEISADIQRYLTENPPIPSECFQEAIQIAQRINNPQLLEQCRTAQLRCQETMELLQRHLAFLQAQQQWEESISSHFWSSQPMHLRRQSIAASSTTGSYTSFPSSYYGSRERTYLAEFNGFNSYSTPPLPSHYTPSNLSSSPSHFKKYARSNSIPLSVERNSLNEIDEMCNLLEDLDMPDKNGNICKTSSEQPRTSTPLVNSHISSLNSKSNPSGTANKTCHLIIQEMIQTERDYVKSLEYIIENYMPELMREDVPQVLRGKRNVVFGNLEKIYEFHKHYFLQELEECEQQPFSVGYCFSSFESQFYLYALYNKNKPKSDALMADFGAQFFKQKQLQLEDKMDLGSYLLKPVQRLGKYALLLQHLIKECPNPHSPEAQALKRAEELVRFQLRHGNDLLAMDAIRECDVNLKEQGRLLCQDEFLVSQGGRGRKYRGKCRGLRQVFLFEELLVFSKARPDPVRPGYDLYQYRFSLKTSDLGLTQQVGESNTKFEVWYRKCKLPWVLQAQSPSVKDAWVGQISRLLWRQALRNREIRMAEMVSMGMGSKPCLEIKPNQDQISDRSVAPPILSKYPTTRFRNSIAISSFDDLHSNSGKRPQSIISISSSSSHSSELPKSDASHCSAESGFFTDLESPCGRRAERSDSLLSSTSFSSTMAHSDISDQS